MPSSFGYTLPSYWRFTCWGTEGMLEGGLNAPVLLYRNGARGAETLSLPEPATGEYLRSFLGEIRADSAAVTLSTEDVLEASRIALAVQNAADRGLANVAL